MTRVQTKEREAAPDLLGGQPEPQMAPAPKPPAKTKAAAGLPAKQEPPNLLAAIVAAAADPSCQPEKMHALLDVRSRLMKEAAEVGYRRAYREAKKKMPRIDKDGKIDEGTTRSGRQGKKSRYATYENLNAVIGPILEEVGLDLSLHSEPLKSGEGVEMRATLSYIAETPYGFTIYAESSTVPMPPDMSGNKNPAQGVSSALAYAKRNAVILVLNIVSHAPEDRDRDGEAPKRDARTGGAAAALAAAADGAAVITKEQFEVLVKEIAACGVGSPKFCQFYGIDKVADLPASKYEEALAACRRYKQGAQG